METVLTSLMSAAATLTSLNLVFLGITVNAASQVRGTERDKGSRHHRRLAKVSIATFVVGILDVALAAAALLSTGAQGVLLPVVAVAFFVQLAALLVLAVYALRAVR